MNGRESRLLGGLPPWIFFGASFCLAWVPIDLSLNIGMLSKLLSDDATFETAKVIKWFAHPEHLALAFSLPFALAALVVQMRAALHRRGSLALLPSAESRWSNHGTIGLFVACLATGIGVSLLWGSFNPVLFDLLKFRVSLPEAGSIDVHTRPSTLSLVGVSLIGASIGGFVARIRQILIVVCVLVLVVVWGAQLPWLLSRSTGVLAVELTLLLSGSLLLFLAVQAPLNRERMPKDWLGGANSTQAFGQEDWTSSSAPILHVSASETFTPDDAARFESRTLFAPSFWVLVFLLGALSPVGLFLLDRTDQEEGQTLPFLAWLADALIGPGLGSRTSGFGAELMPFLIAEVIAIVSAMHTRSLIAPLLYPLSRREIQEFRFWTSLKMVILGSAITLLAGSAIGALAAWISGLSIHFGWTFLAASLVLGIGCAPWIALMNSPNTWIGRVIRMIGIFAALFAVFVLALKTDDLLQPPFIAALGLALALSGWPLLYSQLLLRGPQDRRRPNWG